MMLADLPVEGRPRLKRAWPAGRPVSPGIVVTDMRLPRADGMEVLCRRQAMDADPPVIITGHGDVTLAVEAMRSGASDFIQKPFAPTCWWIVVRRAPTSAPDPRGARPRRRLAQRDGIESKLIGARRRWAGAPAGQRRARHRWTCWCAARPAPARSWSPSACTSSRPRDGPSWPLNCGGLPDNLLDSELFGHEAGAHRRPEAPHRQDRIRQQGHPLSGRAGKHADGGVQIKLLRVLQERVVERLGSNQQLPVDCRVVAATKDDLEGARRTQTFRADLYYRLNVVTIDLPLLRERREDIPLLLEHFLPRRRPPRPPAAGRAARADAAA